MLLDNKVKENELENIIRKSNLDITNISELFVIGRNDPLIIIKYKHNNNSFSLSISKDYLLSLTENEIINFFNSQLPGEKTFIIPLLFNKEELEEDSFKDLITVPFLEDINIVYAECTMSHNTVEKYLLINEEKLKDLNMSLEELSEVALNNLKALPKKAIESSFNSKDVNLYRKTSLDEKKFNLHNLRTNYIHSPILTDIPDYGANILLDTDTLDKIFSIDDYYLVPSGKDSIIVVEKSIISYESLNDIFHSLNENLPKEYKLSDYIYSYDKENHKIYAVSQKEKENAYEYEK